ncbi:hypothetical protein APSETT444_007822 [Aspergillus pseudonomiae]
MAPNPKLGDMMDEVDFELCLDIDQYGTASRRESKRLSTQSATDSIKHDNVQTAAIANPKVRKHGELDSASDIDENITPEQPHHPRPCKKLKALNHSESDLEDDHDRTYLDIAIKRITHHDQEILSDADDTDPETHSSTSASTTAINEEEMDLDTDTDAEVHANSSSDDIGIRPVYSYIARPSHFFEIYEDLDDSHLENYPGFMSSFTTYSSHHEDKENIRDNHHGQLEQTQEIGVNSQMWIRQSTNRVSHVVSSRYQGVDGGADTDEADTDVEEFLTEGGESAREGEMEEVRVSFHSLGAGETPLLPLAFPLPLRIPSPALVQGGRADGRRRCLGPRPVVHFE